MLAFACAPRSRSDQTQTTRTARTAKERASEQQFAATPRIESALDVSAKPGDVRFDFHVTNTGGGKAEMNFASGQTHELFVLDTLGREVWRWSKGRVFTRLLQNKVLRNNDSISFDESWKDAPKGEYVVVAQLVSSNFPVEQRLPFAVR